MLLAVLEARCGLGFGDKDVYLNIAGGLRINEPAADLAAAAALISSALDMPLPQGCVVFGEIGLSGEVRAVNRAEARLREAKKLGFDRALAPSQAKDKVKKGDVAVTAAGLLTEVVERISQNRY
jgi:DNA repair protein RadA/Sms